MYEFVSELATPYAFCMLALAAAIIALWRSGASRRVKWAVTIPYVILYVCSHHLFSYALLSSLEWRHQAPETWPADMPIVVLSAGYLRPNPTRKEASPSSGTFERMQHAAEIYQQAGPRLVICAGGRLTSEFPEPDGVLMCRYLERLGLAPADLVPEENSRNTWQNAEESARILSQRGYDRAIIVTHATHMHRSILCFGKYGITCTAAPVQIRTAEFRIRWSEWFMPHPSALALTHDSLHEYLGIAWYWLNGRFSPEPLPQPAGA